MTTLNPYHDPPSQENMALEQKLAAEKQAAVGEKEEMAIHLQVQ